MNDDATLTFPQKLRTWAACGPEVTVTLSADAARRLARIVEEHSAAQVEAWAVRQKLEAMNDLAREVEEDWEILRLDMMARLARREAAHARMLRAQLVIATAAASSALVLLGLQISAMLWGG